MICKKCGTEFEGSFCPKCGERAEERLTVCPVCGKERGESENFCSRCGYAYERENFAPSKKTAEEEKKQSGTVAENVSGTEEPYQTTESSADEAEDFVETDRKPATQEVEKSVRQVAPVAAVPATEKKNVVKELGAKVKSYVSNLDDGKRTTLIKIYRWIPTCGVALFAFFAFLCLCSPVMFHAGYSVCGNGFENAFSNKISVSLTIACIAIFIAFVLGMVYFAVRLLGTLSRPYSDIGVKKYYTLDAIMLAVTFIASLIGVAESGNWAGDAGAGLTFMLVASIFGFILLFVRRKYEKKLAVNPLYSYSASIGKPLYAYEKKEQIVKKIKKFTVAAIVLGAIIAIVVLPVRIVIYNPASRTALSSVTNRGDVESKFGRPEDYEGNESSYDYYSGKKYVYEYIIDVLEQKEEEEFMNGLEDAFESDDLGDLDDLDSAMSKIEKVYERLDELAEHASYKHTHIEFNTDDADKREWDKVESYYCVVAENGSEDTTRTVDEINVISGTISEYTNEVELTYEATFTDGSFIKGTKSFRNEDGETIKFSDVLGEYSFSATELEKISEITYSDCSYLDGNTLYVFADVTGEIRGLDDYSVVRNVVIEDEVTLIANDAFSNFTNVSSISGGENLVSIGTRAFDGTVFAKNSYVGGALYFNNILIDVKPSTKELLIAEGTTSVSDGVFSDTYYLEDLWIPSSVKGLKEKTFTTEGNDMRIYCQADSQPSDWDEGWNAYNIPVQWNVKQIGTSNSYDYFITNSGTLGLARYNGSSSEIVIPSSLNGIAVSILGKDVFTVRDSDAEIVSITIPASVIRIDGELSPKYQDGYIVYCAAETAPSGWADNWTGEDSEVYWDVRSIVSNSEYKYYITNSDATVVILKYYGTATDLTIDKINNTDVAAIEDGTFEGKTSLVTVTIGDSVKKIGDRAFRDCYSITSVTIGSAVVSIGDEAFFGCSSLANIFIPSQVKTMGSKAFKETGSCIFFCESASAPSGWASDWFSNDSRYYFNIAELASNDSYDYALTNDGKAYLLKFKKTAITLNLGSVDNYPIELIGEGVFKSQTSMTSVTFGDNVKVIEKEAFAGCTQLANIYVTAKIREIGQDAFKGTQSLETITVDENNAYFKSVNNVLYNYEGTRLILCAAKQTANRFVIPDGVETIESFAFYGNKNLETVIIPSSVDTIKTYAFGITSIKYLYIPSSVDTIEENAFGSSDNAVLYCNADEKKGGWSDDWNHNNNTVEWGVKALGLYYDMLYVEDSEGNVEIMKYYGTATEIAISEVDGKTVTSIAENAFYEATSLEKVVISDSVKEIGYGAFAGCTNLSEIDLPYVGMRAGTTQNDSYQMPLGYIFGNYNGDGFYSAVQNYYGVSSETTVWEVYYLPIALKSVSVRGGIIPHGAFQNCAQITDIAIGKDVSYIGDHAFEGCKFLESVALSQDNTGFVVENGALYDAAKTQLYVRMDDGLTMSFTVPDTIVKVHEEAFRNNSTLTEIIIPDSVTEIGKSVFTGCGNLENLVVPFVGTSADATEADETTLFGYMFGKDSYNESVSVSQYYRNNYSVRYYVPTSLISVTVNGGDLLYGAFYNFNKLQNVTLGDGINSIGDKVFYGCSSLTEVNFGADVANIGTDAFRNCTSVTKVTVPDVEMWLGIVFANEYSNPLAASTGGALYVTGEETPITEITVLGTVTAINDYAFYNNDSVKVVTTGDNVTKVGKYAFYDCDAITTASIGNAVTEIGAYAFYDCSALTTLSVGSAIESFGEYAFRNCSGLTTLRIADVSAWCEATFADSYANPMYYTPDFYVGDAEEVTTELVIPEGTTAINQYALYGFEGTAVYIPYSVGTVGQNAVVFATSSGAKVYCEAGQRPAGWNSSWTNVSSSDIVWGNKNQTTQDGKYQFVISGGNAYLTAYTGSESIVTVPTSVTSDGATNYTVADFCGIYGGNTSLVSVIIPEGFVSVSYAAFSGCTSLQTVVVPSTVTTIEDNALSSSSITAVCYNGTEEQWASVAVGDGNSAITEETLYFYAECVHFENQWTYDDSGNVVTEADIAWDVYQTGDCEQGIVMKGTCNVCHEAIDIEIPATGHVFDDDGVTCTVCGYKKYETTNDTSHPFTVSKTADGINLASTNKTDSSSASYVITANETLNVSFKYNTSSESNYDFLRIYVNGIEVGEMSGTNNSDVSYSCVLNAGDTLKFTYSKDNSQSSGNDCAYIKNLVITVPESAE